MALSDLQVFNKYLYSSMTEVLRQKVELFNAASQNTIILNASAHEGDYSDVAFWKKISGLVRRRDSYGSGAVSAVDIEHLLDTAVKVAAGTPPVNIPPSQMLWIQRAPEEMAAVIGQQLAVDAMADMLNTAIGATSAALGQVAAVVYDPGPPTADISPTILNEGSRLFGDAYNDIKVWVMHSKSLHDYYESGLTNTARLFTYGTVNVIQDAFGRTFIVSDSDSLIDTAPTPDEYFTLGLVTGAVVISQNNDFYSNIETSNGDENILRTFQAEWSWSLGIKGFKWDKTNGGASPTTAALTTATNWDRYATSVKDLAGVKVFST